MCLSRVVDDYWSFARSLGDCRDIFWKNVVEFASPVFIWRLFDVRGSQYSRCIVELHFAQSCLSTTFNLDRLIFEMKLVWYGRNMINMQRVDRIGLSIAQLCDTFEPEYFIELDVYACYEPDRPACFTACFLTDYAV